MAIKLNGSVIAAQIRAEIREQVAKMPIKPVLAVVMVGNDDASRIYVKKKEEACTAVGIDFKPCIMSPSPSLLTEILEDYSCDRSIHGILLQLPLPDKLQDETHFFTGLIRPDKDVDVFHPENIGLLVQGRPRFKPCTPHGIQQLLSRSGIQTAGKHVVIINRSDVVGKPLSSLLIQDNDEFANATVTVCHNRSDQKAMKQISASADIVVVAVGQPNFLTKDMVKPGAVVVDVGINRKQRGEKTIVVGDVHPEVEEVAGWLTPTPGGVGPMTVAMLLENVVRAAQLQLGD
jgi:methylenetetrahydrofolate dehydrogenase (NADP+)/methenyltetrahydrofolate cyclohydrolase